MVNPNPVAGVKPMPMNPGNASHKTNSEGPAWSFYHCGVAHAPWLWRAGLLFQTPMIGNSKTPNEK
jgi:hypothetical protein